MQRSFTTGKLQRPVLIAVIIRSVRSGDGDGVGKQIGTGAVHKPCAHVQGCIGPLPVLLREPYQHVRQIVLRHPVDQTIQYVAYFQTAQPIHRTVATAKRHAKQHNLVGSAANKKRFCQKELSGFRRFACSLQKRGIVQKLRHLIFHIPFIMKFKLMFQRQFGQTAHIENLRRYGVGRGDIAGFQINAAA